MSSDFSGNEGRGYADDDIASPSSSLVAIIGTGARASLSGNSFDLLVDSDAPEEVAIHVDSTGAWDGKLRAWPTVPGYDWVPQEVRQISSSFHHRQPFRDLIGHISLVKAAVDARHFKLAICQMTERVCHDRGNYPTDFFYVYATMFKDLKVLLPFSDFQMGVLRTLNVAPTQLHPNGWAFMQAFSAICSGLALKPTPAAFLYFFHVQPHLSKPWVSLRTVGNKHLLSLYNSSYKDFKGHFFKPQMTPEDLDLINQLCQLPPKSSCRVLIGFLGNKNLPSNVFDYLSKMDPSKNSTFARLFAQRGGETSNPPPAVEIVPDQAPPVESNLKKKGKRKVAREASAESKHAKRRMPDGPPLPGLLSPNSWVAKRLHFELFTEEKALVSGMTEEEASNMALELIARFNATFKANQDLNLRLAETEQIAEEDKKKANTLLAEARATQHRMQRSLDDAKLNFQKATSSNATLTAERDSLHDQVTKLEAENKLLGDEVINEHVLGFDKDLTQCNLVFQVPTDDPRLDVSMMVVDNKLVPIYIPPSSPPAAQDVDATVEVVGETDKAEGQS
ncbi:hypothetical protein LR48_Vigan08g127500 [Vigna angularis]|uniref:Transposase (putative) gypsy type domain-containing protein n=1 Tax=Phaseolus angularis TaxID=3914 RepID=A0A0L9V645_PHAAN|nr:hypothetical protein LR48_Vigan08g127500 [Vigna angularis]